MAGAGGGGAPAGSAAGPGGRLRAGPGPGALAGLREEPKYQLVVGALAEVRAQLWPRWVHELAEGRAARGRRGRLLPGRARRRGCGARTCGSVVATRREEYARELRRRQVPGGVLSDGTEPEAVVGPGGRPAGRRCRPTGSPASAGTVTSTARVVLDPVGARLEPGEVLVAPSTDRAGHRCSSPRVGS